MQLRTAFKGPNKGNQFWGCRNYPGCKGARSKDGDAAKPRVAAASASPVLYREEWPSPEGFEGGEWRFVPVATQVAVYGAKPRFNHYAIQLPAWRLSTRLDEKQVSALHVARKLLQRGEAILHPGARRALLLQQLQQFLQLQIQQFHQFLQQNHNPHLLYCGFRRYPLRNRQ